MAHDPTWSRISLQTAFHEAHAKRGMTFIFLRNIYYANVEWSGNELNHLEQIKAKLVWNNTHFVQENIFENFVCKMGVVWVRYCLVKMIHISLRNSCYVPVMDLRTLWTFLNSSSCVKFAVSYSYFTESCSLGHMHALVQIAATECLNQEWPILGIYDIRHIYESLGTGEFNESRIKRLWIKPYGIKV